MNMVIAYNPKSSPADLRCELDDAQWKVDRTWVPKQFVKFWFDTTGETIATFKWDEWRWLLPNLQLACRWSLSASLRAQLDEDEGGDIKDYVGDSVRHCTHTHITNIIP